MKKSLFVIVLCLAFNTLFAQNMLNDIKFNSFGIQLGTDVGGAIPTRLEYIPSVFRPFPKMYMSIGAKAAFSLAPQWYLGLEANYKTIEMGADALVENMLAFAPNAGLDGNLVPDEPYLKQYYTGQAKMNMSFTMLEVPLYGIYAFPDAKNKIVFGAYGAWVMSANFVTEPLKGYIGSAPNEIDMIIEQPDLMTNMDFSRYTTNWDAGILVGYEREVFQRVNLGVRLMVGFKDIFQRDIYPDDPNVDKILEYNMTHVRGTFVLSYDLFRTESWWHDNKKTIKL